MVTYFMETAGARDIELRVSYENGHLLAQIFVDYLDGGWSPDLIFGERDENKDSFASEVLGPAVARVLVRKMDGEIRQSKAEDGRIVLSIDVPVQAMEVRNLKVLLNMQSTPMEMICKSTVSSFPIEYVCENTADKADIVMMESGAADEGKKVAETRRKSPMALVFGIGRPQSPALFDFVAEVPLEAQRLKNRISEALS